MTSSKSALFICVHNSARSQMAEEYLKSLGGDAWRVESAGFEPGVINPLVVRALQEDGIDISGKQTQDVFDLFKAGRTFQYVVTVCQESEEGRCPVFPGMTHRLHLPFPDPSKLSGSEEEQMAQVREIRDSVKRMIKDFLKWEETGEERRLGDYWSLT